MLELNNIIKKYSSGDSEVLALNGVSLKFRKNEFVSILGASGCGKTTMLNIIGGLDRYTDGDLVINGISTKAFKDRDWDTYRNHSIGFVFQSYNLIPHQSVLSNVELALTLSGVSKHERRQRAKEALQKVGLGDQLHKRPSQMSGGQMQRVAIARALVNNPEILLADEPTGALDTATSVQIMELLKEVAADRLVIMVTHNPELAAEYSTRIVRLSDGVVVDDTDPYVGDEEELPTPTEKKKKRDKSKGKKAKTSMSFLTALSLSTNNLLTKKGRTTLTSFAGSIGIIGIALVLSLSTGINAYIDQVQEDTLSTFPLTINKTDTDVSAMMNAMTQVSESLENQEEGKIYVDNSMGTMVQAMSSTVENDLEAFKKYLDDNYADIADCLMDVQYTYDMVMQIYSADGKTRVNPTTLFENMGDMFSGVGDMIAGSGMGGFNVMSEMINNQSLLDQQYELVEGAWPSEATDVVLVISKNNQLSLMTLYMLGEVDQSGLDKIMEDLMTKGEYTSPDVGPFEYDHFIGKEFHLLANESFYVPTGDTYKDENGVEHPIWKDIRKEPTFDQVDFVTDKDNSTTLKISGIIRPKEGTTSTSISGAIGYTKALTDLMLDITAKSDIIKQQMATPKYNVLTGMAFERTHYTPENFDELIAKVDKSTMESYFYPFVTKLIKGEIKPEGNDQLAGGANSFGDLLNVADKNSFMSVFMLTSAEYQAKCIEKMIASAQTVNPMGLNMLCQTITAAMGGKINVTPDNFVILLDVINEQNPMLLMAALNGIPKSETVPMDITGLIDLAGTECMTEIYSDTSAEMKNMQVNEEIFTRLIKNANLFIPDFGNSDTFKQLEETLYNLAPGIDATYESNLKLLDNAVSSVPASINLYAKDFASKDAIKTFIDDYNKLQKDRGDDKKVIKYTDVVGILMSSISTIINVITYVLIAFVSISLIVSSIMIGIITYISVVERTKEIGILRAIGASKRDISRVFNAETFIVGLISGIFGIGTTLLLNIPINAIIHALSGISSINAVLPWQGALILVAISMMLTIVAGLFPSRVASKKDPVEALRSE